MLKKNCMAFVEYDCNIFVADFFFCFFHFSDHRWDFLFLAKWDASKRFLSVTWVFRSNPSLSYWFFWTSNHIWKQYRTGIYGFNSNGDVFKAIVRVFLYFRWNKWMRRNVQNEIEKKRDKIIKWKKWKKKPWNIDRKIERTSGMRKQ